MTEVRFTHNTYKTEALIYAEQVFAVIYLPTMASTVIIGPGSTALPVTDTVEEANRKLQAAMAAAKAKESK